MKRLRIGANYVRWQIKSLRGQGMVEFALALPVFLLLVLGIMEFSWMLFHYSITFSASREAARYGSSVGLGATNLSRDIDCVGIRAEAFRVGRPAGITTNGQVEIRYDLGPDDPTPWASLPSCDNSPKPNTQLGWRIAVRVTADHNSLIGIFPSFPITGNCGLVEGRGPGSGNGTSDINLAAAEVEKGADRERLGEVVEDFLPAVRRNFLLDAGA